MIAHLPGEGVRGADHVAHARVAVGELFRHQDIGEEVRHVEQPQRARLLDGLERHRARAVPLGGKPRDLLAHEVPREIADGRLLVRHVRHRRATVSSFR